MSNIIIVLVPMLIFTTSESIKVTGTFSPTRMFPELFCQSFMFVNVIAVRVPTGPKACYVLRLAECNFCASKLV